MEITSLRGLVLVYAFLLAADGSAIHKRSSQLHPIDGEVDNPCRNLAECASALPEELANTMAHFDIGNVYSRTNYTCRQTDRCLIGSCDDRRLKAVVIFRYRIEDWVCANLDRFKTASKALRFQDSLSGIMTCVETLGVETLNHTTRPCVLAKIDERQQCTADNKRFFLSVFDFYMGELMTMFPESL